MMAIAGLTMAAKQEITWLNTGDEAFELMLAAIEQATQSIRLEMYIYTDCPLGRLFRDALVRARNREVDVQIMVDSLGSLTLSDGFWASLRAVKGEVRWFNPFRLRRFEFRNHRKLLICDNEVAFIGGFNISEEYQGDGVAKGWRDLGIRLTGDLVKHLAFSFDEMFANAEFQRKRLLRLRRTNNKRMERSSEGSLLLSGPGRGRNPFRRQLLKDLDHARDVRIIAAYFLPGRRMRRALMKVVSNGGRVQLIFAGKSDVQLSQLACRSLYRQLLKAGVEIYEYSPQILHAKLMIVDQSVYIGSSNLDPRSIRINYELMIRFHRREVTSAAREIFNRDISHCKKIEAIPWGRSLNWWQRLRQRWAYFLLAELDPFIARRQYEAMVD